MLILIRGHINFFWDLPVLIESFVVANFWTYVNLAESIDKQCVTQKRTSILNIRYFYDKYIYFLLFAEKVLHAYLPQNGWGIKTTTCNAKHTLP